MNHIVNSIEDLNLNKKFNIKENPRLVWFLPNVTRCIVNGSSGCGKTNLILNILYKIFEKVNKVNLNICTKTIQQDLYQKFIEDVSYKHQEVIINTSDSISNFGNDYFNNLNPEYKEIIIIDDMLGVMNPEDKKALIHLFSASRPRKISIFFLTQRYTKVEISCRRNCNYLITFKPSLEEANTICSELTGSIMYPSEMLNRFDHNAHYSLFFDLEKMKCMNIYEIFKISNLVYYRSLDDLVEKFVILIGETNAGNDSEEILDEIYNLYTELEKYNILKS